MQCPWSVGMSGKYEVCMHVSYFVVIIHLYPFRGEAADSIHHLITYLMKSRQFKSPEWLAAIPIFHFLKGYSQPFQKPELNPEKISWDMRVELDAVRSKPGYVGYTVKMN